MSVTSFSHPLQKLAELNRGKKAAGVYSLCSAHPYVLRAGMRKAKGRNESLIIEATANQVNQYGGYTGMSPGDFRDLVNALAAVEGFPEDRLILGGDHLGPLVWRQEPEGEAMKKAEELVAAYVRAGFSKIHIDTSMSLTGDAGGRPDPALVATRAARLVKSAEEAFLRLSEVRPSSSHPVYIVGSEVPVPGGSMEEEILQITRPEDFNAAVEDFRRAFEAEGLSGSWPYVIGVVVQPGVEFGDGGVHDYCRASAGALTKSLEAHPHIVFEGHSTDYQHGRLLRQMVEDGIAILKVGPALTFALREGLFLLSHIEDELYGARSPERLSNLREILERAMLENPVHWIGYYHGAEEEKRLARCYSLCDRCRYYLSLPAVGEAVEALMCNLRAASPSEGLIHQYFPEQYRKIRQKELSWDPEDVLMDKIGETLEDYQFACTGVRGKEESAL